MKQGCRACLFPTTFSYLEYSKISLPFPASIFAPFRDSPPSFHPFRLSTSFPHERTPPRARSKSCPTPATFRVYVCPDPDEVAAAAAATAAAGPAAGAAAAAPNASSSAPSSSSSPSSFSAATDAAAAGGANGSALVLRMKPIMHATLKWAEVLCFEWSPHEPDLLLAGASDGETCTARDTVASGSVMSCRGSFGRGGSAAPPLLHPTQTFGRSHCPAVDLPTSIHLCIALACLGYNFLPLFREQASFCSSRFDRFFSLGLSFRPSRSFSQRVVPARKTDGNIYHATFLKRF